MAHSLPSRSPDSPLATFTAFFKLANFTRNGEVTVTFALPAEMKEAVLDLSSGDGMAMNVTVWETELPDVPAEMAKALGLDGDLGLGGLRDL